MSPRASTDHRHPLIEFCGQIVPAATLPFTVGRHADLVLDADNRFLHRRSLSVERHGGLFVLVNIGSQLSATVSDPGRRVEAQLAPGGVFPLLAAETRVRCVAGPTTYEFSVRLPPRPPAAPRPALDPPAGDATVRRVTLTPEQLQVLVVLAEPTLRGGAWAGAALPTNAAAAERLGWTVTKFNRKLDNLCTKFAKRGVRGLRGGPGRLASYRRARLVEFAIGAGVIGRRDLELLP